MARGELRDNAAERPSGAADAVEHEQDRALARRLGRRRSARAGPDDGAVLSLDERLARVHGRRANGLFLAPALVVRRVVGDLVHARILHDVLARDLPGLLHDPRKRAVLPRGLLLDLLQHLFGKVEALLTLVRAGHGSRFSETTKRRGG